MVSICGPSCHAATRSFEYLFANPQQVAFKRDIGFFLLADVVFVDGYLYAGSEEPPYRLFKFAPDLTLGSRPVPSVAFGTFGVDSQIWLTMVGSPGDVLRSDQDLRQLAASTCPAGSWIRPSLPFQDAMSS